ncbi:MAG TPA: molybdopterin cofactor-binding domain-containing protein [Xanthobacteraceae bacterium]|jgi:CO/xanthine dehydrogenase Mo-binding subunit
MNAISRRDLVASLGSITLAFTLAPQVAAAQQLARLPASLNNNRLLDGWIRIGSDGTATISTGKVEFGQGIVTALAQIAAEELDLPLDRVQMISGDTERSPNEGVTAGSQSIESSGTALRLAGAQVRAILLGLAANRLGVDAATLSVADGVITAANGRSFTYAELAAAADLHREATGPASPKPASARQIVGKSIARLDIPPKVTGGAAYVQDLRLPGMLHGRVVRPPSYGAKLEAADEARIKAMPGVVAVVRDGSFLGVVAEREEQAIKASLALAESAKWRPGPPLPEATGIYDRLLALPTEDKVVSEKQAALPAGAKIVEATYRKPYMAHASIGPSCAVAEFSDDRMTVWTHSQGVFPLRANLAMALKMPAEKIRCIHAEGAGCYGHNGADDVALDAALLARGPTGRPVRVQWMRGDEFAWEPFGPAMVIKASAALSPSGRIIDWNYELWSNTHSMRPSEPGGTNLLASWYLAEPQRPSPPRILPQPAGGGDRNAVPLYDFPRQRIVNHFIKDMPLRISALRTLGAYANVFATESFMDELALAAGADPVAFRLAHLTDPRARAVIEAVARKAGWTAGAHGNGTRGRGLGFAQYKKLATYVAAIAEVEVDRASGRIAVPRVYAAADAGAIINPDGLANQIEGGIVQSASWTLKEEVKFDPAGIKSRDWASYPILTMPECPTVEVELIDRPEERPLGAGEAAHGPAAAAIANAFAAATGKRLRELPLTPARVKAALA